MTDDDAASFVSGKLVGDPWRRFASHIDDCERCRRLVSALAAADAPRQTEAALADWSEAGLRAGEVLGRFTLVRLLGHGSMGEVWAARDRELDREIALKLLRLPPGELGLDATTRIRREAQAMARLNHPNVVAIYELGSDDGGRVFCAMELVDGVTLRRWLETPRAWRAVFDVARAVGRGIEAAHAAGLIHRDIKPENILIARNGRPLVSDFGLAKLIDLGSDGLGSDRPSPAGELGASNDDPALTATGAVIGTPLYMAPEQAAGGKLDARSDQFSFCASIYEALFDARPFAGDTLDELGAAIRRGPARPADLRGVPSGVLQCLLRGLDHDPSKRWPSMAVLIDNLERAGRRPRQRRIAIAVGLAGVIAIAGVLLLTRKEDPVEAERAAAEQRIAGAWNPIKDVELHLAFVASGNPNARERAATASRLFNAYRADWITQRLDAWFATHVRGEQTAERLERRLACFEQLAESMDALVGLMIASSRNEVEHASQIIDKLEPVATCGNVARLSAPSVAPSTPAGKAAERRLRELEVLQMAGRHAEVLQRARALVDDAERLGEPMMLARARFDLGSALENGGHLVEAEQTLRQAVQDAAAAQDHYLVAEVWLQLFSLTGQELKHSEAAAEMEPAVRAAVAQAGNDPRQVADLAMTLGLVAEGRGDFTEARDRFVEARDRRIAARGPNHPAVGNDESNIGAVLLELGQLDEATTHLERAITIMHMSFGDNHPVISQAETNLASIAARRKDWATSEAHDRKALAIDIAVRGPDHPKTAQIRVWLARALREQKRFAEARDELEQAATSMARSLPATHPSAIMLDLQLANLAEAEEHWDEAARLARRGVERLRAAGASSALRASALADLARFVAHGSPVDGLPIYDEALRLYTEHHSRDVGADAVILEELAHVALAAHRPAAAIAWFDRMPKGAERLPDLRHELELAAAHRR